MILIDTNIWMYAAGADHPHKAPSGELLERIATGDLSVAIDAEVLQEILHRYRAIGRWNDGKRVFDLARRIASTVFPVTLEALNLARELLDEVPQAVARDALHAAIARLRGCQFICSYDADFDDLPGAQRLRPEEILDVLRG